VEDFELDDSKTTASVTFEDEQKKYDVDFLEFENFTCAYALISEKY